MNSHELNIMLITSLPEILSLYEDEVSWQEGHDTGSYVVYADVLIPYLIKLDEDNNLSGMKKVFEFIEQIIEIKDEYATGVLRNVLDGLFYNFKFHERLLSFMGQKSKEYFLSLKK